MQRGQPEGHEESSGEEGAGVKAISLHQPWATLLASGVKRYETRSWPTRHRGPLVIHAGKTWNDEILHECLVGPLAAALHAACVLGSELPLGAFVGVVEVVACKPTYGGIHESGAEWALGDWSPGRFAWDCQNARRLERPIPARGYQRIWNITDEQLAQIIADEGATVG